MDEAAWLAGTEPESMLKLLRGKVSERKLRLFACACCRRLWRLLEDQRSRDAVMVGERYADEGATADEFSAARRGAIAAAHAVHVPPGSRSGRRLQVAAYIVGWATSDGWDALKGTGKLVHRELQARLIRCIFGNPFRPVVLDVAWRTPTVVALATAAYDNRILLANSLSPDHLAVLSDALEDAGCDNDDILSHLRGPGPHVRGCWVIDLLLGKE